MGVGARPDRDVYHSISAHRVSGLLHYEITHVFITTGGIAATTLAADPGGERLRSICRAAPSIRPS